MRHKKKTIIIDRKRGSRIALIRILCIHLIEKGHITTTPIKAKAVRLQIEHLITKGKVKNLQTIRLLESVLANKKAALRIVNTISPRFQKRAGGYTRLTKVAPRKGDGADQVILEFVSEDKK